MDVKSCFPVAFLLDNLAGGGAEQVLLNLAGEFAQRGHPVDLLVCSSAGPLAERLPVGVSMVELPAAASAPALLRVLLSDPLGAAAWFASISAERGLPKSLRWVTPLANYLRSRQPAILLSNLPKANLTALLAARLAGVPTGVIISAQNNLAAQDAVAAERRGKRVRPLRPLMARYYPRAAAIVAASDGVAENLIDYLKLPGSLISRIYNPVITPEFRQQSTQAVDHPWLQDRRCPVIIASGRLVAQKDFPLLVEAFARLRESAEARLLILGGDESSDSQQAHRAELVALAQRLGVADDIAMPGFQPNPAAWMAHSQVFVLSSRFEGFGNVVAEALYCGCRVVSTNCPSGPAEILAGGRYGRLVDVGDAAALAEAMLEALADDSDLSDCRQRAEDFSVEVIAGEYLDLFRHSLG